jgi:hypothetical protein
MASVPSIDFPTSPAPIPGPRTPLIAAFNRSAFDERTRRLRAHLSDEALASAWGQGRAMPLEEALMEIRHAGGGIADGAAGRSAEAHESEVR